MKKEDKDEDMDDDEEEEEDDDEKDSEEDEDGEGEGEEVLFFLPVLISSFCLHSALKKRYHLIVKWFNTESSTFDGF